MKVWGVPSAGLTKWTSSGRTPRCVDCEHGEGLFKNLREGVDGVFLEEDELARADFMRCIVGDDDLGRAGENVEVLVATGVEVCRNCAMDTKDAAARGLLIGQANIGEHGLGRLGKRGREGDW